MKLREIPHQHKLHYIFMKCRAIPRPQNPSGLYSHQQISPTELPTRRTICSYETKRERNICIYKTETEGFKIEHVPDFQHVCERQSTKDSL